MSNLRVNDDGSLPILRDAHGRPYLDPLVEDQLTGGAPGQHPSLATHESLGLAAAHDHPYAADDHTHAGSDHPDLAAHTALGLAASHSHDFAASGHNHDAAYSAGNHNHDAAYSATGHSHSLVDGDIPASIARDAEVTSAIATHAATPHGGEAGERYKVGDLYITTTNYADAAAVATAEGYGTWSRFGVGRFLLLTDGTAGTEGGSATHSHSFTQPDDHAALTHSGTAVGNHTFTQPTAAGEAAHTHTYTQVVNHVHVQTVNSATTGGLSGYTPDTSSNTPAVSGYSTQNPTGGVAQGTTAAGSSHTHSMSGGAVDAHSVTQPSQHAAQSHAGGAVADGATTPLSITAYAWLRTA